MRQADGYTVPMASLQSLAAATGGPGTDRMPSLQSASPLKSQGGKYNERAEFERGYQEL